ncbi:MAG TPA: TonB-dependent receptor [Steroidobacteraceae bacterium]|nr:TonB-dependent receptor [Steroidobacteraceae bacterium]
MKAFRFGAAFAVASVFVTSINAAPSEPADEIVSTATRIEQPISDVIGSVTVITRKDIENRAVQSLQDLMRGEVGISVANTGGMGKLSNVFLRGTDAEQVLVLVDGIRVGSATSGTTPFEFLPIDQVERIEIIRGPRSSIYGSDAIGGVIQIFTKKGAGSSVTAGGGSNSTYKTGGSLGLGTDHSWFNVSANRVQTEGYNSCDGAPLNPDFTGGGGCFTHEPDRDGYHNNSASLRTGYSWENASIEANALYATGTTEFDGSFTNETDFTERVIGVRGRIHPSDAWALSLLVGDARDNQDNFFNDPDTDAPRIDTGFFNTDKRNASLQSDLSLGIHQLTVGVDYLNDRVDSDTPYDQTSRDNIGTYAVYQTALGAHRLLASARYDDNEQFGGHSTGSIGWKWNFTHALAVHAAWGTAFGAPTFNDLYYPGFSNPHLDPERSRNVEFGISGEHSLATWSLVAFDTHTSDLIVYDSQLSAPNNVNNAQVRGLEAQTNVRLGAWSFDAGLSRIDPRNRTPGFAQDNYLPRRSRTSGHFEVARDFGAFAARARLTAEGSRYDDAANTHRLGGYGIVDLVFDYTPNEQWKIQGKLGNAFDHAYRTVRFYNQEGRTYFVTLIYSPAAL